MIINQNSKKVTDVVMGHVYKKGRVGQLSMTGQIKGEKAEGASVYYLKVP